MEEVYGRTQYMGEEGRFRKCKGSVGRIQREDECRSKETRKIRYDRRERLQCYDLKSLEWDNKTTFVLSNTRELDRVPSIE